MGCVPEEGEAGVRAAVTPDLLRRARMALGLSQQELADRLDVKKETVYRWEKGRMAFGSPDRLREELLSLLDKHSDEIDWVRHHLLDTKLDA